jgi:hypothetical protein
MLINQYWSLLLGRIIKSGSAGKDRLLLEKAIVAAIRELAKQSNPDSNSYDLLAFIALSLTAIGETIEESVTAWEKRGYWVKADRYRMEWNWSPRMGKELKQALLNDDLGTAANIIAQITQKLSKVKVSNYNKIGSPWAGSWDRLIRPK